jgi:hypothetical protein
VVRHKKVTKGLMIRLITLKIKWRSALGYIASKGWRSAAVKSCLIAASLTAAKPF